MNVKGKYDKINNEVLIMSHTENYYEQIDKQHAANISIKWLKDS